MNDSALKTLARTLLAALTGPRPVEDRALRLAAEEVLLPQDADRWERLFAEDGDGREMLAELLLFPDAALRREVEPLLGEREWTEDDVRALAEELAGAEARFRLPEGGNFAFALTGEDALTLVRRLRPTRCLPPEVRLGLGRLPESRTLDAAVRLRLARFPWERRTAFCLSTLFMRLASEADFMELLDFLCLFLEAHHGEEDLAGAMVRRRDEAERHLKSHLAFQERLAKSNFETMYLTGDRAVHADPEALAAEMRAMDRLCPALFGRAAASAPAELDLGELAGEGGVRDMLRLMDGG